MHAAHAISHPHALGRPYDSNHGLPRRSLLGTIARLWARYLPTINLGTDAQQSAACAYRRAALLAARKGDRAAAARLNAAADATRA